MREEHRGAVLKTKQPRQEAPSTGELVAPDAREPGVFANRDFLLLWVAQALSQTAQNAIWYGIVVLVQERSQSSMQLSLAVLSLTIPSVIFGVVAGVYVDRWDKRGVLVGTNLLRGAVALAYIAFGLQAGVPLTALFVTNFVFSTIGQFFAPAETATIPALVGVPRLMQANSLFHLTFTTSQLVGLVLLGPLLVKVLGTTWLFGAMAVTIILCGGLVWPLPRVPSAAPTVAAHSTREAIRSVLEDARVVGKFLFTDGLVGLAMVQWTIGSILGLVVATIVPGFAQKLLEVAPENAVFVMAPAGIGMVAGAAVLNRWGNRFDKHYLTNAGLMVVAAALGCVGLGAIAFRSVLGSNPPRVTMPLLGQVSSLTPVIMGLALIAGFGFVAIMVPIQAYLQEHVPVDLRGRVFSIQLMLSNLATIVPLLVLGTLADLLGPDTTLLLIGVLIGVAGAISMRLAPGTPPWVTWSESAPLPQRADAGG